MATLTKEALAVINRFGNDPGVSDDHVRNLYVAVAGSPVLADQFNKAVASGAVKGIDVLTNANAGAEYDPAKDAVRVPLSRLTSPQSALSRTEITFTLGHEIQHGLNSGGRDGMLESFRQDVIKRAQSPGPVHDYTDLVQGRLDASRNDEAISHVAGWNALVSLVKDSNPNATLQDVYAYNQHRAKDFVDAKGYPPTVTPKGNLTFSSDLSLAGTEQNIEATAKNWYDKVSQTLGAGGSADYPNYYARGAVSQIVQIEHHFHPPTPGVSMPVIGLDMTRLKLSEKQLEEAGLDFGANTTPMTYLDTSQSPRTSHTFQHTKGTLQHVSPVPEATPDLAAPKEQPANAPRHPLHEQAEKLIKQMDRNMGRESDVYSDRMAASVAKLAKESGFDRIDHVVLSNATADRGAGETVFAVKGDLKDPAHEIAYMPTQKAVSTPVEDSVQELARLDSVQQQAAQSRQQSETISREQQSAPTRGMA